MPLLFDDLHEQKAARPKAAEPEPVLMPFRPAVPVVAMLGVIEDSFTCMDDSCGSGIHDIVSEERGQWFLRCWACGTGQWARAIKGHLKPQKAEFTFPSGDYAGLTIQQARQDDRGRAYVEWAAGEHQNPEVRTACQNHLDSIHAAP